MTQHLVVLGGSGDAYLIAALLPAYREHHGRDARLLLRSRLVPVAGLFGEPYAVDDALVERAERDPGFQAAHDNALSNAIYYAHPCFTRSAIRVDKLTTHWDASQADMYRMILGLPMRAPLALPCNVPRTPGRENFVVVIEDSTSWPNTQPEFWRKLVDALRAAGRDVWVNDKSVGLDELFRRCGEAEWVIGPQCGVMSVLVSGQFPCRKTLCTPNIDGNVRPEYLAENTAPYCYVTKFDHHDYDVEEYKVSNDDHDEIIRSVIEGPNSRRLWPHEPWPVTTVMTPLAPSEFYDRLAVLRVKRARFTGDRRAAIEREYRRYSEIELHLEPRLEAQELAAALYDVHLRTFDLLEALVPDVLGGNLGEIKAHAEAIRLNRERVTLKKRIDATCRAPYGAGDVKSYYD